MPPSRAGLPVETPAKTPPICVVVSGGRAVPKRAA